MRTPSVVGSHWRDRPPNVRRGLDVDNPLSLGLLVITAVGLAAGLAADAAFGVLALGALAGLVVYMWAASRERAK